MSYDIYLVGIPDEPITLAEVGNHTSNTTGMWTKAIGYPLADMEGKRAGDCIADLARAVEALNDPARLAEWQAMEPPNKWGSHESATLYLEGMLAECRRWPNATVRISR